MKISKKAFTLMEIMVAVAIVSIMAAVVLVSMQSYGAKARSSKALAQLSSMIPSMYSCWGNGGQIKYPSLVGGRITTDNYICEIVGTEMPGYGLWVQTVGDLEGYYYSNIYVVYQNQWVIGLTGDDKTICCNVVMNNCKILDESDPYNEVCTQWGPAY